MECSSANPYSSRLDLYEDFKTLVSDPVTSDCLTTCARLPCGHLFNRTTIDISKGEKLQRHLQTIKECPLCRDPLKRGLKYSRVRTMSKIATLVEQNPRLFEEHPLFRIDENLFDNRLKPYLHPYEEIKLLLTDKISNELLMDCVILPCEHLFNRNTLNLAKRLDPADKGILNCPTCQNKARKLDCLPILFLSQTAEFVQNHPELFEVPQSSRRPLSPISPQRISSIQPPQTPLIGNRKYFQPPAQSRSRRRPPLSPVPEEQDSGCCFLCS